MKQYKPVMAFAQFEDIGKEFPLGIFGRRITAVSKISLTIEAGEVLALLGPNRAGKTTLVKILLSLCHPTSGRALRFQRPLPDRSTLARVGYVHEHPAFPLYLSASALLELYGALTLLPELVVRQRVAPLLDKVGLADRAHEPIAHFSKGMIQRLALAQALMNDPDLLVLDEPSEGLDLAGRQLVRDIITERRQRGASVLLVSHLLADVEKVCDRLAVLVRGRLVFSGSLAELTRNTNTTNEPGQPVSLEQHLDRLYRGAVA